MTSLSPSQLIYQASGHPLGAPVTEACWLCGAPAYDPAPVGAWVKDTFNDYDKIACPTSPVICAACIWCAQKTSAELAALVGKDKPQNFRNYSHFVSNGQYIPLTKADKPRMIDLLGVTIPELAIIADSGQKHLYFRATLNPPDQPAGWVQFEEQRLFVNCADLVMQIEIVKALLALEFSKTEILSGDYIAHRITRAGLSAWWMPEERAQQYRQSRLWRLSVFLSTHEEEAHDPEA